MGTMDLDGQLTQEQFHSSQVGCISNDFDVNEFEWEEEEQEEEDRIGDVVSSDSDDSVDDQRRSSRRSVRVGTLSKQGHVCRVPRPLDTRQTRRDRLRAITLLFFAERWFQHSATSLLSAR